MNFRKLKLPAAVIMLFLVTACGEAQDASPDGVASASPVADFMADPAAVMRGEALFVGSCAGFCHSLDGPNEDALFLFDCEWQYGGSNQDIFDTVTNGIPNTRMVGFGSNFPEGENDLHKIIAYLRVNEQPCD